MSRKILVFSIFLLFLFTVFMFDVYHEIVFVSDNVEIALDVSFDYTSCKLKSMRILSWLLDAPQAVTKTFQVCASEDDAEYHWDDTYGHMCDILGDYLKAGMYSSTLYSFGVRFRNFTVPRGSKIQSAKIKLYIPYTWSHDDPNCKIWGHDVGDSPPFQLGENLPDLINRPRTSVYVYWSAADVGTQTWVETPDISSIIQEIVDRSDWQFGNAITILFIGEKTGESYHCIQAGTYDLNKNNAPKLEVTYIPPGDELSRFTVSAHIKITGEHVKSRIDGIENTCNYTINVYHSIDNVNWYLAANDTCCDVNLPHETDWSSGFINMLSASSEGSYTYYIKFELTVYYYDLSNQLVSETKYVLFQWNLYWQNCWLGQIANVEYYVAGLTPQLHVSSEGISATLMVDVLGLAAALYSSRKED